MFKFGLTISKIAAVASLAITSSTSVSASGADSGAYPTESYAHITKLAQQAMIAFAKTAWKISAGPGPRPPPK